MLFAIAITPFSMGFESFYCFISRNNNPFPEGSNDYDSWNHGWDNAMNTVAWGDEDDWHGDDED